VTTHRKMTIATWSDSQVPIAPQQRAHRRFLPPVAIGLAGSLLLHGLVLQTVVLGSGAHKIRPPEILQPGSPLNKPADALVFVDLPNSAKTTDEIDEALAPIRAAIKDSPIPVTHPDPSPPRDIDSLDLAEDKDSASSVDNGDGTERARLFGIYTGQIQARVERIWRRPRTPVQGGIDSRKTSNSAEYFHCQVQIVQESNGSVREIMLPNCNGSIAWQHSLVTAIQQAAPLPAPPSPAVFQRSIALSFIGYAYGAGSSEEDYEIAPIRTVQTLVTH
jgi:TonB C terminal